MEYNFILKNGNIITLNQKQTRVDWVCVKNGKIAKLGKGDAPECSQQILDLDGATVLPGLFDSHVHIMPTGFFLGSVNLLEARTIKEVIWLLEQACRDSKEEWVFGAGFMAQNMEEDRFPTRDELDKISNGHPVMIAAQTLHGISLNSKAINMVQVPDVPDLETDETGQFNGVILSDNGTFPVMGQIFAMLPEHKLFGFVKECGNYAAAKGVTSLCGLVGQFVDGDKDVSLILERKEDLPVNVEVFYQTWDLEKVKALGLSRIGGCLTLDGAGFEYTMALNEPYANRPERRGFLLHTDEEIYNLISKAHGDNIQCAFHALGERAIDQLVYLFHQVTLEQGRKDLRHRIEHFSQPSDRHMDMLSNLGLIASMQPAFAELWGQPEGGAYEGLLGRASADRMEIFPEIIKRGGMICGGSDSPVTLIDPLFGIACCIRNTDPRRNISVTDALKCFTINAAYSVNLENRKGTIELGKDADFTVIDTDPYAAAASEQIYEMKVLKTIRAGKITYER